jgi:hypothetical protein
MCIKALFNSLIIKLLMSKLNNNIYTNNISRIPSSDNPYGCFSDDLDLCSLAASPILFHNLHGLHILMERRPWGK